MPPSGWFHVSPPGQFDLTVDQLPREASFAAFSVSPTTNKTPADGICSKSMNSRPLFTTTETLNPILTGQVD